MNYIQQLQADNRSLEKHLEDKNQMIQDFKSHLLSSKFQGEGNDYIQTQDVFNWLDAIGSVGVV